jgi:hypothetical protein
VSCKKDAPLTGNINNTGIPGTKQPVEAMVVYNGNLVVMSTCCAIPNDTNTISVWNGSSWSSLPVGNKFANAWPYAAMCVYNGNLIVGCGASNIYQWNGSSLLMIGNLNPISATTIRAMTVYNGNLIVGGSFNSINGVSTGNIAMWNGSMWSSIGSGIMHGSINALTIYKGNLVAGGAFDSAGGQPAKNIAMWNGSTWLPFGNVTGTIIGFEQRNNDYAIAACEKYDTSTNGSLGAVVFWNDSSLAWGLEADFSGYTVCTNGYLYCLASTNGACLWIQTWGTGSEIWLPVSGTLKANGSLCPSVNCMVGYKGSYVVGGCFSQVGNSTVNNIMLWYNNSGWIAL